MKLMTMVIAALSFGATGASADTWPHSEGSMKHLMVMLDGTTLGVHIDGDPLERIELIRYRGEHYTAPADVLDERFYSDRYGWMADGFIDLPSGSAIFVETIASDAGLDVHQGGMRSMKHMHTYAPILGTGSSDLRWMWDGTMVHNWYAADQLGTYDTTYSVYVGDASTGAPLPGYTGDTVTLRFRAVPAPGALALAGAGLVLAARRRRGVLP